MEDDHRARVNSDRMTAIAIFAVVLASRVPFTADTLWAHDSALYASALEKGFHVDDDPARQRPHPPGYFFYVVAAGIARVAGLGSNDALVLLSALASALACASLFLLARQWIGRGLACATALSFAAAPLVWLYSEVAYPYTVLAVASVAVAAACWHARGHGLGAAIGASLALGIAGGWRQDLLLLAAPLWLWTVAPLGRHAVVAAAAGALACLSWFVPTVWLSGGLPEYLSSLNGQVAYVRATYSFEWQGLPALASNAATTGWALLWGTLLLSPIAVRGFATIVRRAAAGDADRTDAFLALWTLPALGIYVVLHIGEWGYVLSVLPGIYIIGARELAAMLAARQRSGRVGASFTWGGGVVLPAVVFAVGSGPFTADAITTHDTELTARVAYVREQFNPRSTLILTREDFLLVRYYLPEFRARQYDPEPFTRSSRRIRTGRVEHIVVFTPGLEPQQRGDVRRARCRDGVEFVYLDVIPGAVLEFKGERYAIAPPGP